MAQIEHLLHIHSGAREYYPIEGQEMDLGPTNGCKEVIRCLEIHCRLVKGSAAREVLEVFYIEVGTRLHGYASTYHSCHPTDFHWYSLIQKHLKRQIISLQGGFQVIADLNAYHSFILSLKIGGSQNGQQLTQDFASFKMLGHVFIVEDAKDLATIVRDTARYGGRFRPEVGTTRLVIYVLSHRERRMCTNSSNAGAIGRKLKRLWTRRCITLALRRIASSVSELALRFVNVFSDTSVTFHTQLLNWKFSFNSLYAEFSFTLVNQA